MDAMDDLIIEQRLKVISSAFDDVVFVLNSNSVEAKLYIALGAKELRKVESKDDLSQLETWLQSKNEWSFGFFSYDLKNLIEDLNTLHPNRLGVPLACFITPSVVLEITGDKIVIVSGDDENQLQLAKEFAQLYLSYQGAGTQVSDPIELLPRMDKSAYLQAVERLKDHIQLGDVYEVNYCQEFYAHAALDLPLCTFNKLNALTAAPFAAYMQIQELYLLSASPERFLKKVGDRVISQPIKGTVKRDPEPSIDQQMKEQLRNSLKEQTENVMIVDLVRNDLSRFARRGSVNVPELFGVQSFKTVHHLVSTVECKVSEDVSVVQMIKSAFPMGSMTGAPKIRAMQLADELEVAARGLYSGSVGYITPKGDFDFNVIIRSIIYNSKEQYISSHVGGAITALCNPEEEYEECLLKAAAIRQALRL